MLCNARDLRLIGRSIAPNTMTSSIHPSTLDMTETAYRKQTSRIPFYRTDCSSLSSSQVIAEARASLQHPLRPMTPHEPRSSMTNSLSFTQALPPSASKTIRTGRRIILRPLEMPAPKATEAKANFDEKWSKFSDIIRDLDSPKAAVELMNCLKELGYPGSNVETSDSCELAHLALEKVVKSNESIQTKVVAAMGLIVMGHFSTACGCLFALSQSEDNDDLFRQPYIMEKLIDCSRCMFKSGMPSNVASGIALVGLLRNVTCLPENHNMAVSLGLIQHFSFVLYSFCAQTNVEASDTSVFELLNQVTAAQVDCSCNAATLL